MTQECQRICCQRPS